MESSADSVKCRVWPPNCFACAEDTIPLAGQKSARHQRHRRVLPFGSSPPSAYCYAEFHFTGQNVFHSFIQNINHKTWNSPHTWFTWGAEPSPLRLRTPFQWNSATSQDPNSNVDKSRLSVTSCAHSVVLQSTHNNPIIYLKNKCESYLYIYF